MSYRKDAQLDEVWADHDGCLYTPDPFHKDGWQAFGTERIIYEDNPLVKFPMYRVFDSEGKFVSTKERLYNK